MTISRDEFIYQQKLAQDRASFYAVTGKTYIEMYSIFERRYESRPRKMLMSEYVQQRMEFYRRLIL